MSRELAAMEPGTGRGGGPQAAVQVGGESIVEALRAERGVTHTVRRTRGSRRTLRAGSSRVLSYESRSFRQRRGGGEHLAISSWRVDRLEK